MKRAFLGFTPLVMAGVAGALALRCGSDGSQFDSGTGLDAAPDQIDTGAPPSDSGGQTTYSDFPASPIVDPALPANIGTQFGAPSSGSAAAPCIAEPAADAMVPRNWTPLFMEYSAPGANVYEIRLSIDNQQNTAVIYTPNPTYVLDQTMWKQSALHSAGHDITLSIRGGTLTNGQLANVTAQSTYAVHIAPVDAPGSVVYWSSSSGTSFKGFTVGDLTSKTVLTPATASPASASAGTVQCVSCHTSSPDGKYIFYTRDTGANSRPRALDARTVVGTNAPPSADVSASALSLLARSAQMAPVFSPAHYSASDAVMISVLDDSADTGSQWQLVWTDLHATSTSGASGIIARTNDPNPGVSSPSWRHDGTAIAYVSSTTSAEGVIAYGGTMDIYTVPYNGHAGGTATKLPGASDSNYHQFYPVYSPNDTLLAFNRTANTCNYGTDDSQKCVSSYNQVAAEMFLVPSEGGSAQRLRANDPPACTTLTSPGLTNAWPRWAPQAQTFGQYKYYWVVFSSRRRPATGLNPQLYVAAIITKVTNGTEMIYADYPAVYVLSQDPTQNNHTPVWDNFNVQGIPN